MAPSAENVQKQAPEALSPLLSSSAKDSSKSNLTSCHREYLAQATSGIILSSFLALCLLIALATGGVGDILISWLEDCFRDAGVLKTGNLSLGFNLLIKTMIWALLYLGLGRWIASTTPTITTLVDTILFKRWPGSSYRLASTWLPDRGNTIYLSSGNPIFKHFTQTLLWLTISYSILFYLAAFCPGELGDAIRGFLDLGQRNQSVSIFLASLVAMWGATPLAIMLAAFLPSSKAASITIHPSWGIFQLNFFSLLPFWRSIRLWSDFSSAELSGSAKDPLKKRSLVFRFKTGGSCKIKLNRIDENDLNLLLGEIDEHTSCGFSQEMLEMRKTTRQYKIAATSTAKLPTKYSATVFQPLANGERLYNNRLRIIKQLASKPLTAVYLVKLDEAQLAVLKQFSMPTCSDEMQNLQEIFDRECRLLKELDHRCITKVIDIFASHSSQFLLLQYIPGTDLYTVVKNTGPLPQGKVIEYAIAICRIMLYLHNHKPAILHRDLSPDNLVLNEDGEITLIDFGSAHQFAEGITGTLVGKQAYIAPEQLRGKASCASDIYSFGGCLYFLLTGKEPTALSSSKPSLIIAVNEALDELILQTTAFDEKNRPGSFSEILETLQKIGKKKSEGTAK